LVSHARWTSAAFLLIMAPFGSASTGAQALPAAGSYMEPAGLSETVEVRLAGTVDTLLERVLRDGRASVIAGVPVFSGGDKFLPGKLAAAMSHRVLELPPGDPRLRRRLADFSTIADMTLADPDDSWGVSYYLEALRDLERAGLLDQALNPQTLARLRTKLDWRTFVRADYSLRNLPSNYYGVAQHIAQLRFLLGWEDGEASRVLLARTLDHYRRYSGTHGFADETDGDGRYDRYSVLLAAELAQRLADNGIDTPAEVRRWLRASVDVVLPRLNIEGQGWEYGRSIGPYGDTALMQVLTAAAGQKLLTPDEERMAYAFVCRVAARYMDFWLDPATGAVDMWDRGRRTDRYRGRGRVLGESLSLARQFNDASTTWNRLGYRGRRPDAGFTAWLDTLPRVTTTWFSRGGHDRVLVTLRDGRTVLSLPIINGGRLQHVRNPYFPVPFSPGMLQGAADSYFPQLLPRFTLRDGSVLMPLAFFKDVRVTISGDTVEVTWRQSVLDQTRTEMPTPDPRVRMETRYRFSPGRIERRDVLRPAKGVEITSLETVFATFSAKPKEVGAGSIRFDEGQVTDWRSDGYGKCGVDAADDPVFRSTTGPFSSVVRCAKRDLGTGVQELEWSLSYTGGQRK
jgi:hypothetical protein